MVKALRRIPIFSGLAPQELLRLSRIIRLHQAPKNQLIFQKQMAGSHLFIVLRGKIKIFSELAPTARKKSFAYVRPGEFFGEMTLLDAKGRSLSAIAMEDSELLTISQREFQRLLTKDSRFMLKILRALTEHLRKANEEIESLTFKSLYGRVCGKLLDFIETKGARDDQKPPLVAITHNELAEFAGTARELVTKVLSSLRRLKIIDYADHKIVILSLEKLKELTQKQ